MTAEPIKIEGSGGLVLKTDGIKSHKIGDQEYMALEDLHSLIVANVKELVDKELCPKAAAAQEARNIIDIALKEILVNMTEFQQTMNLQLRELRVVKSAVVTEVAEARKPLEEIREFFLGSSHELEIARLKEFIDTCERLQKLQSTGFLNSVTKAMTRQV